MIELLQRLGRRYEGREGVWVGGDLMLCYDREDGRRFVCPDAMVVVGSEPRLRDNFLLWKVRAAPAVVFEITSALTRR